MEPYDAVLSPARLRFTTMTPAAIMVITLELPRQSNNAHSGGVAIQVRRGHGEGGGGDTTTSKSIPKINRVHYVQQRQTHW